MRSTLLPADTSVRRSYIPVGSLQNSLPEPANFTNRARLRTLGFGARKAVPSPNNAFERTRGRQVRRGLKDVAVADRLASIRGSEAARRSTRMLDLPLTQPRLPTLEQDGWTLDDGEAAHESSPETYWIPPPEARRTLQIGQLVKLRFYIRTVDDEGNVEDNGERMWVEVKGRIGDWYRGELANQPACTDAIEPGFEVWFEPRHVIDIHAC